MVAKAKLGRGRGADAPVVAQPGTTPVVESQEALVDDQTVVAQTGTAPPVQFQDGVAQPAGAQKAPVTRKPTDIASARDLFGNSDSESDENEYPDDSDEDIEKSIYSSYPKELLSKKKKGVARPAPSSHSSTAALEEPPAKRPRTPFGSIPQSSTAFIDLMNSDDEPDPVPRMSAEPARIKEEPVHSPQSPLPEAASAAVSFSPASSNSDGAHAEAVAQPDNAPVAPPDNPEALPGPAPAAPPGPAPAATEALPESHVVAPPGPAPEALPGPAVEAPPGPATEAMPVSHVVALPGAGRSCYKCKHHMAADEGVAFKVKDHEYFRCKACSGDTRSRAVMCAGLDSDVLAHWKSMSKAERESWWVENSTLDPAAKITA